jgi:hypothetical protein
VKVVPPPYVSSIQDGRVRLEGLTPLLRSALRQHGQRVERELFRGEFLSVGEDPSAVLVLLAGLGVAFLADHRQGWSPEAVMLELKQRGLLPGGFLSCGFDGQRWLLLEVR